MNLFHLKEMKIFPYEERDKNVFFKSDKFKIRLIELAPGEKMPDCTMRENVIFYVLKGETTIQINDEKVIIKEGDCLISEPGNFSMISKNGVKILGIQIKNNEN
mgnify:CR=1 FL=1|jgi:quercetin dioxygenase-like cupin family protein